MYAILSRGRYQPPNPEIPGRPAGCPLGRAAHALDPLVDTGVPIAMRLRPDPNLPVDGSLPGGNDHPTRSRGGLQYRAGPGAARGLLLPAPGLVPQPGPGSKQAHPRLVRSGLPAPPRHPARERQVLPDRERHPGRQVRTQDARGQEAPSTIRVKHQAGVHLRPLLPGGRRADPSLVQRVRLASGLPHPRRRGVFQPRPANAAGKDGPADRLTGPKGAVLLRGRRLLCHRQHRLRVAGPGKPLGHAGQEQQRSFLPGNTPAAEPEAAQGQACKVREKDQGRSAVERERPAPGGPRPRGHPASMARRG